jgi:hypothetical protein
MADAPLWLDTAPSDYKNWGNLKEVFYCMTQRRNFVVFINTLVLRCDCWGGGQFNNFAFPHVLTSISGNATDRNDVIT